MGLESQLKGDGQLAAHGLAPVPALHVEPVADRVADDRIGQVD